MAVTDDNLLEDIGNTLVGKSSIDKKDITKKKEFVFYKYSKEISLAEAIFINNRPMFLQIQNGTAILSETINLDDQTIISPPDKSNYLSKEYVFSSKEEVEHYIKRAQTERLDSLYYKAKGIWNKYYDNDKEPLTLCAADTIFTYFQDKMGMTHYLLFIGDNNSGKSNALRVFNNLGYRPLFEVDTTPANIYNFLGQFEEGQGIILEDELGNIEEDEDKMKIYKSGYVSGAQVTRMYDSTTTTGKNTTTKRQQKYNTFCFKAFSAERQPNDKAKGLLERIFPIKCSPGSPQYDISEITNDAGDPQHKKLYREIEDLRKLLLVYRIMHYDDKVPDIELSITNRDKQLCKPLIRLFNNTKAQEEIVVSLSKFLAEKNNKKLDSFDAYLYSMVSDIVKEENTPVSNEVLWSTISSLPGSDVPNRPLSYNTEDFGIISRARVTKTCEDKFGAAKGHDGQKRSLVFNKTTIQKLKTNYSPIKEIKIINNSTTNTSNTSNTFNTFWKCVERNERHKDTLKSNETVKNTDDLGIDEDMEHSTDSTSITVNVTPMSKEEEDAEQSTETNNISIF